MPLNGAVYVSKYKHKDINLVTLGYFAIKCRRFLHANQSRDNHFRQWVNVQRCHRSGTKCEQIKSSNKSFI